MHDTWFRDLFTDEEYVALVRRRERRIAEGAAQGRKYWKRWMKLYEKARRQMTRRRLKRSWY